MGSLPMFGQFLGSTMSDPKKRKKFSHAGKEGQVKMYMNYAGSGTPSAPTPKPSAGRLASQTGGRTASSYQARGM